jgi:predicted metal-dependent HD superfamily phosphohydrolase
MTVETERTIVLDISRWSALTGRFGVRAHVVESFLALASAYAEPHRAYHNADHINDCLHRFDEFRTECDHPDEVELAIWYHDVVYDPLAKTNEAASAEFATRHLRAWGMDDERIRRVGNLILLTKHDIEPATNDGRLAIDVDLAILAADEPQFDEYDRAIRREYSAVPDAAYRSGRLAILRMFLDRPTIYCHPAIRVKWEGAARANLRRAIDALSAMG